MRNTPFTNLNAYHQRRNARLLKEISEQPLMSRDECIAQAKRLESLSRKQARKERGSTG